MKTKDLPLKNSRLQNINEEKRRREHLDRLEGAAKHMRSFSYPAKS